VKDSRVDNAVLGTTLSQLSFGNWSYSLDPSPKNIDDLFLQSQILVNTDILTLVKSSQNPESAIQAHIAHTEKTISQIQSAAVWLQEKANDHLSKSKECLSFKRQWDALFFKWVQQSDERMSDEWLAMSLEYAPCYITNRIQANAQAFLQQKVQTNARLLQQRSSLLTKNKELLVANSSYFEWNILEELLLVKQQMKRVNSVSFDTFSNAFSFEHLWYDYKLPKYDSFVIRPDKIPTFEDPGLEEAIPSDIPSFI